MSKDPDQIFAVSAEPLEGEWIRVEFSDGAIHEIGVRSLLSRGGVFEQIRKNRALFEQVRVNPESRAVEWPEEIDVDSEVLYGLQDSAFGTSFKRRIVRRPSHSAA
ncbi:MAG TPA: DUF2442 domain-containing protein [Solirubrobacterales bacterium]|nr:DUF2442 domain-containing protein [Solirubrobacterales bacterium]